jgi:hypothetical protein
VLQLLSDVPAGQHVLLLVLHAADSSSFNRSLLGVMLARAERLLSSSPASLAAAGGLGQQAASLAALGSYCSYLCFVAGAVAEPSPVPNGSHENVLLQQQPVIDMAAFLARAFARCSFVDQSCGDAAVNEDRSSSWQLALSVPFACAVLRFAGFNASAASSASVGLALQQLQMLQGLSCMSPTHEDYGRLPACLLSCLAGCQLLQDLDAGVHACTSHHLVVDAASMQQQHGLQPACGSALSAAATEVLSRVVAEGSALVDDVYWIACSPGLQQLTGLLAESSAAVARQLQQQQQQQGRGGQSLDRAARESNNSAATSAAVGRAAGAADRFAVSRQAASTKQDAHAIGSNGSASADAATEPSIAATHQDTTKAAAADNSNSSSSSPSGGAGAPRHTTPLLLAPRTPPVLDVPPECLVAALAAVGDPVVQQLQQAFIAQYSTDDNPVSRICCYT